MMGPYDISFRETRSLVPLQVYNNNIPFLPSLQGFFRESLYLFLNGELIPRSLSCTCVYELNREQG
jgi:hypothetical protein